MATALSARIYQIMERQTKKTTIKLGWINERRKIITIFHQGVAERENQRAIDSNYPTRRTSAALESLNCSPKFRSSTARTLKQFIAMMLNSES